MKIESLSVKTLVQNPEFYTTQKISRVQDVNPLLISDQINISKKESMKKNIDQVKNFAINTLDSNTWTVTVKNDPKQRQLIVAGKTHFNAFWTRDAMYASMGQLAAGKTDSVRDSLSTLLDFQFDDGLISRRMGHGTAEMNVIKKTLGLNKDKYSNFDTVDDQRAASWWTGTKGILCPDGNLLMTIVAGDYVKKTNDKAFLNTYYDKINKALGWVSSHTNEDGMVVQTPFSDWKDVVNRGTTTMYNQALYYQALQNMSEMADLLGKTDESKKYKQMAEKQAGKIQEKFWDNDKGYFRDSELFSHFSPDGNLFAVAFGLTTPAQTAKIFSQCDSLLKKNQVLPATESHYPDKNISFIHRKIGLRDYHDDMGWTWQNSLYSLAASRAGDKKRAEEILGNLATVMHRDGNIFEVYDKKSQKPVDRFIYKSERNFSWSAGLFLQAEAAISNL